MLRSTGPPLRPRAPPYAIGIPIYQYMSRRPPARGPKQRCANPVGARVRGSPVRRQSYLRTTTVRAPGLEKANVQHDSRSLPIEWFITYKFWQLESFLKNSREVLKSENSDSLQFAAKTKNKLGPMAQEGKGRGDRGAWGQKGLKGYGCMSTFCAPACGPKTAIRPPDLSGSNASQMQPMT